MSRPMVSVGYDRRGRAVVRSTAPIDPYDPRLTAADRLALAADLLAVMDEANTLNGDTGHTLSLFPDTVPDTLIGGAS